MKLLSLLSLTMLLIGLNTYSQETLNNFKIDKRTLVWQKVYETPLTFQQLRDKVKDSGDLESLDIGENKLSGDLVPVSFNWMGAGFKKTTAPLYMLADNFSGSVIIDYQEGKYKVTVKRIEVYIMNHNTLSCKGDVIHAESGALKRSKTEFRKSFLSAPSIIWDYTLSTIFDMNEKAKDNL